MTEIGNTAILRSTGVAASQSAISSQEAKDFKVVVAHGQSARRNSAGPFLHRQDHHRHAAERADHSDSGADRAPEGRPGAAEAGQYRRPRKPPPSSTRRRRRPARKRFRAYSWCHGGKAAFRKVETGITGATDIEVLSGLKEGDQIVTGTYQVIRTIKNDAQVKVDNKPPDAGDVLTLETETIRMAAATAEQEAGRSAASSSSATASSSAPTISGRPTSWATRRSTPFRAWISRSSAANTSPSWGRRAPANRR